MTLSFSLNDLERTAAAIKDYIGFQTVVAFHGNMGAGKTTVITALCRQLGVVGSIGSPTYSIINQYQTNSGQIINHMDWYRLKDEEEAFAAGVEDALYSGNLCLVEWPENAAGLLPPDCLHLSISVGADQTRTILIEQRTS